MRVLQVVPVAGQKVGRGAPQGAERRPQAEEVPEAGRLAGQPVEHPLVLA